MAIARKQALQEKYLQPLQENLVSQLDIVEEILPVLPNESTFCPAEEIPDKEISDLLTTCDSKLEQCAALLAMFFGGNLTQTAFNIVVQFLNSSKAMSLPKTFDQVADFFLKILNVATKYQKIYYCSNCRSSFETLEYSKQRICTTCKGRIAMNYYFDIDDQLNKILAKDLIDFEQASRINLTEEPDIISDVSDGAIYRDFLRTSEGTRVRSGDGITFCMNTDGCNPSEKSAISLWPVFLSINEIPIGERYCIDNTIIAGKLFSLHFFSSLISVLIF